MKRTDQDEGGEIAGRQDDTPIEAQLFRPNLGFGPAPKADKKDEERISIFWRVFGGTLLSIAALVLITLYNNLTSTISELRAEHNRSVTDLRAELVRTTEARADLLKKDEFNTRMASAWDGIKTTQASVAALATMRAEVETLKDRLNRQAAETEAYRKDASATVEAMKREQAAATDALKKDVAGLEFVKERLTALAAELKQARDESTVVRSQLDRNQAYDQERKVGRDKQFAAVDADLKALQKAVQECREKLAGLEGRIPQAAPMPTPAPRKAVTPRPTPAPTKSEPKPEAKPEPAKSGEEG